MCVTIFFYVFKVGYVAARCARRKTPTKGPPQGRRPQDKPQAVAAEYLRLRCRNRRLPAHGEEALREAESFRLAEPSNGKR